MCIQSGPAEAVQQVQDHLFTHYSFSDSPQRALDLVGHRSSSWSGTAEDSIKVGKEPRVTLGKMLRDVDLE